MVLLNSTPSFSEINALLQTGTTLSTALNKSQSCPCTQHDTSHTPEQPKQAAICATLPPGYSSGYA